MAKAYGNRDTEQQHQLALEQGEPVAMRLIATIILVGAVLLAAALLLLRDDEQPVSTMQSQEGASVPVVRDAESSFESKLVIVTARQPEIQDPITQPDFFYLEDIPAMLVDDEAYVLDQLRYIDDGTLYGDILDILQQHYATVPVMDALERLELLRGHETLFLQSRYRIVDRDLSNVPARELVRYIDQNENKDLLISAGIELGEALVATESPEHLTAILEMPPSDGRRRLMTGAIRELVLLDPEKASEVLLDEGNDSGTYDEMISLMLERYENDVDPGILFEWAGDIQDPDLQEQTIRALAVRWAIRDPKASEAFLMETR